MPCKTNIPAAVKGSNHPGLIFAQAKQQIAQAETVDQVNDIRKKAMALAAYALQANKRQLKQEADPHDGRTSHRPDDGGAEKDGRVECRNGR